MLRVVSKDSKCFSSSITPSRKCSIVTRDDNHKQLLTESIEHTLETAAKQCETLPNAHFVSPTMTKFKCYNTIQLNNPRNIKASKHTSIELDITKVSNKLEALYGNKQLQTPAGKGRNKNCNPNSKSIYNNQSPLYYSKTINKTIYPVSNASINNSKQNSKEKKDLDNRKFENFKRLTSDLLNSRKLKHKVIQHINSIQNIYSKSLVVDKVRENTQENVSYSRKDSENNLGESDINNINKRLNMLEIGFSDLKQENKTLKEQLRKKTETFTSLQKSIVILQKELFSLKDNRKIENNNLKGRASLKGFKRPEKHLKTEVTHGLNLPPHPTFTEDCSKQTEENQNNISITSDFSLKEMHMFQNSKSNIPKKPVTVPILNISNSGPVKSILQAKNSSSTQNLNSDNSTNPNSKCRPLLNLDKIPKADFHDEFLEHVDDFSPSWRDGCRKINLIKDNFEL